MLKDEVLIDLDWVNDYSPPGMESRFFRGPLPAAGKKVGILVNASEYHFVRAFPKFTAMFPAVTADGSEVSSEPLTKQAQVRASRRISQEMADHVLEKAIVTGLGLKPFVDARVLRHNGSVVYSMTGVSTHLPRSFLEEDRRDEVFRRLARFLPWFAEMGVSTLCLGADTKSAGLDARLAAAADDYGITVVTGNRSTAHWQGRHHVRLMQAQSRSGRENTIALVGAQGSVGRALVVWLLTETVCQLILIGRDQKDHHRLRALAEACTTLFGPATAGRISLKIGPGAFGHAVQEANQVILLTRGTDIALDQLPSDCHLVDAARQHATGRRPLARIRALLANGIRPNIDDGALTWHKQSFSAGTENIGLPQHVNLPCLSEGDAFALGGWQGGHFGIEPEVIPWDDQEALCDYLKRLREELDIAAHFADAIGYQLNPQRQFHELVYD